MKLWQATYPADTPFAFAFAKGTFSDEKPARRLRPLVIEWEPGSDRIGDFVYAWNHGLMATESVGRALAGRFRGFELGPVEMVQDPTLRPHRSTRHRRVWLPYEGPPLVELFVTAEVPADTARSSLRVRATDEETGAPYYTVEGVEEVRVRYDPAARRSWRERIPREPGKGLYLQQDELGDLGFFRPAQLHLGVYCTDRVRDFVRERGYTNIDFLEVGETF